MSEQDTEELLLRYQLKFLLYEVDENPSERAKIFLGKDGIVSIILSLFLHHEQSKSGTCVRRFAWLGKGTKQDSLVLDKVPHMEEEEWKALTWPGDLSLRTFRR